MSPKYFSTYLLLIILLSGCFKEDSKLPERPASDDLFATIEMKQDYRQQVYMNLATEESWVNPDKSKYDLLFSCGPETYVLLNTSKFMRVAETSATSFEQIKDTSGVEWGFDSSDGDQHGRILKNWRIYDSISSTYRIPGQVYILDLGFDHLGNELGIRKLKFKAFDEDVYAFESVRLDNSEPIEGSVTKQPGFHHLMYSFSGGGQVIEDEPPSGSWHLLFTQYTTLLYTNEGEPYPYLVTGVLINSDFTEAIRDTTQAYENFDYEKALDMDFTGQRDVIGYEWKELIGDVESGDVFYETRSHWNYIIKDSDNLLFKLRFVDFYHPETGEKGYPTIMWKPL